MPSDAFHTTRWSVVRDATSAPEPRRRQALEDLCLAYWMPLYAYARGRRHSREDAEDLTQSFLAKILASPGLGTTDPTRGRFRAWMLAAFKHHLADHADSCHALKRGGGSLHLSLDWPTADAEFRLAAASAEEPDKAFDRAWARTLLRRTLQTLESHWADAGRAAEFQTLKPHLSADGLPGPDTPSPKPLPVSQRVAIHRLRRQYRQLLRNEVAQTLADPSKLDQELQALAQAFD